MAHKSQFQPILSITFKLSGPFTHILKFLYHSLTQLLASSPRISHRHHLSPSTPVCNSLKWPVSLSAGLCLEKWILTPLRVLPWTKSYLQMFVGMCPTCMCAYVRVYVCVCLSMRCVSMYTCERICAKGLARTRTRAYAKLTPTYLQTHTLAYTHTHNI